MAQPGHNERKRIEDIQRKQIAARNPGNSKSASKKWNQGGAVADCRAKRRSMRWIIAT